VMPLHLTKQGRCRGRRKGKMAYTREPAGPCLSPPIGYTWPVVRVLLGHFSIKPTTTF